MKIALKILVHSIFWLLFILVTYIFGLTAMASEYPPMDNPAIQYIINTVWAAVAFYGFYFFSIRIFEKKQFVAYVSISIFAGVAITAVFLLIHKLLLPQFNLFDYRILLPPIAGTFIIEQGGVLIRGFENWFADMQLKAELENINLKNELEFLKAQVNPHFLFNTLNNIDSLIFISQEKASESLITLSEMLRYMIYETKENFVSLKKEIAHIQSYIQLQKLRFNEPDYILFSYDEQCTDIMIAPLLFTVFVENAFKYASKNNGMPVIEIKIKRSGNELFFSCINQYNQENMHTAKKGGVGLINVKRRLELLYPGKHELEITSTKSIFSVELKLII